MGRNRGINWGLNSTHQLLANRGYHVMSVNYRGSTGFGKSHLLAGEGQWYGRMQDDLVDAVRWAMPPMGAMRLSQD